MTCSIDGCDRPVNARGWCSTHYGRWKRHGDPNFVMFVSNRGKTAEERFWLKTQKTDTCWLWLAGKGSTGYGSFWTGTEQTTAHRFAYELLVGPVPPGLDLDHLCRVRHCVNPAHLEPVTHTENLRRGTATIVAMAMNKTHCPHGHEYTTENIYLRYGKHRVCRTCQIERSRRQRRRWREERD